MDDKSSVKNLADTFEEIFSTNAWQGTESVSGTGSSSENTAVLRNELQFLFYKYKIKSMLDIPCGDFNWMQHTKLGDIEYQGGDIVESLIDKNKAKFGDNKFSVMDITSTPLPKVDLIFVRDCLGHLSDENIFKALKNIQASGSKYLLATSFTKWDSNPSILDGQWKCINLMIKPYNLKPIYLINENCREGYPYYNDKCMILVDIQNMYSL